MIIYVLFNLDEAALIVLLGLNAYNTYASKTVIRIWCQLNIETLNVILVAISYQQKQLKLTCMLTLCF